MSKNSVIELASRMATRNVSISEVQEEESSFFSQRTDTNPWFFAVSKDSGKEIAVNLDTWHKRDCDGTQWSIPDEELVTIARAFLDEHVNVNQSEVVFDKFRRTHAKVGRTGGEVICEQIVDVTVVFGRVVSGTPVIGPGSKIYVTIDINGNVSGLIKIWREIKEEGPMVETVSSKDAVLKLISDTASLRSGYAVKLYEAKFGYWAGEGLTLQSHFLPTYSFLYRAFDFQNIIDRSGSQYGGEGVLIKGYKGVDIAPLTGTVPIQASITSTTADTR